MPTSRPLDPLFTLGDVLLQLAPHNVLARGGITISPVMARQPTLYEEMNRPVQPPAPKPSPVPMIAAAKPVTLMDFCDQLLQLAPHNVLATLLAGGQMRQKPPEVPAELQKSLGTLPLGMNLRSLLKSDSPFDPAEKGAEWDPTSMIAALTDRGNYISVACPRDREFITVKMLHTDLKETTQLWDVWGYHIPNVNAPTPSTPQEALKTGGQPFTIRRGEIRMFRESTGAYQKRVGGTLSFRGELEHWRSSTFVMLIPPIAPTDNELAANKNAIEVATLKNYKYKKLVNLDQRIEQGGKQIDAMNALYNEASGAMSQLPSSPSPPAPPLAAGGQVSDPVTRAQNSFAALQTKITEANASLAAARNAELGIENASDEDTVDNNYNLASDELGKINQSYREAQSLRNDVMEYQSQAEEVTAQAEARRIETARAAQAAQEAERARAIAESERTEAESAATEARMKAEAEAERARRQAEQAASREELQRRVVAEKEAAAAKAAAAQAAEEERIRQLQEKYRKEEEARRAEEQRKLEEKRQKLESVSAEAARLRQEAARRKLKQKK